MIGISRLYCGTVNPSDTLRYGRRSAASPSNLLQFSTDRKPVVVWNCTRRCNLRCIHCYIASTDEPAANELTSDEARGMIDDLARFGAPVILFSGGEPLLREDLPDLIACAREAGLRTVLSTNGTLITKAIAEQLHQVGLNYCGVSLDGLGEANDTFRGVPGAFEKALTGIRHCRRAGIKVGVRLTMHRGNLHEIPGIFDLVEREEIQRVCFYHLVYTGRGKDLRQQAPTHQQTRAAVDTIMDRAAALHAKSKKVEVLTVDNHADGAYLYLRLLRENPSRAQQALELLKINGGNSSGVGIGCVGFNGEVHPDQFWRTQVLGSVRDRPFSEIWTDPDQPLLVKLRNRKPYLPPRCKRCRWLDVCNGNFRARAEVLTGDPWGDDPACYLTEEEIS